MFKPRTQKPLLPFIVRRRLSILGLILFLVLLFHSLPWKKDHVVAGKWLPDYDIEDVPRFLHRSSFRVSPDYGYERKVSEALQEIERNFLENHSGDRSAKDRIWQIRLGKSPDEERSPDSIRFSDRNNEWEYTVSLLNTQCQQH